MPTGVLPTGQADAWPAVDGGLASFAMTSPSALALPSDPGSPVLVEPPTAVPADSPSLWHRFADLLDLIPGRVWAVAFGALFIGSVILLPVLRVQARKAGARSAGATSASDRRDRVLLWASLTPAFLFWLAVVAGSFRGLTAFGRQALHWRDGWDWLVPFTLDGIAVAFGILAFRAINARRSPDRSMRIAWTAMLASSAINFFHEANTTGSYLGGGYLGVLSLFGMLIFHEFLAQFEDGAEGEWIRRTAPKFGMRWLTWPSNTACAWVAWRNYPPADGTKATVANAVAHLERVRADKRTRAAAEFTPRPTGWARILPNVRAKQLDAALAARTAERAEMSARLDAVMADFAAAEQRWSERAEKLAEQVTALGTERDAERVRVADAERSAVEAEQRAGALAEQVSALKAERRKPATGARGKKAPEQPEPDPEHKPGAPRLSDAEAVAVLLSEHPEHTYAWTSREVHRLTGAGFGRIPKLLAMVAERHAKTSGAGSTEHTA